MIIRTIGTICLTFVSVVSLACAQDHRIVQFGVYNATGVDIPDVVVAFDHGPTWPLGGVGNSRWKTIAGPGAISDAADIKWRDAKDGIHKKHVEIDLSQMTKPSENAGAPVVFFVIHADGSVEVMYHQP